jgi:tetratricopeptide (TPR) repeat protein
MLKFNGLTGAIYEAARQDHDAGRLAAAEQGYLRILAMDPGHYESLHMMGMLTGQIGRHDVSLEFTDKALAVQPDAPEAHVNRGIALASLDRTAEAEASFRKALALSPGHAKAQESLNILKALAANKDPQA